MKRSLALAGLASLLSMGCAHRPALTAGGSAVKGLRDRPTARRARRECFRRVPDALGDGAVPAAAERTREREGSVPRRAQRDGGSRRERPPRPLLEDRRAQENGVSHHRPVAGVPGHGSVLVRRGSRVVRVRHGRARRARGDARSADARFLVAGSSRRSPRRRPLRPPRPRPSRPRAPAAASPAPAAPATAASSRDCSVRVRPSPRPSSSRELLAPDCRRASAPTCSFRVREEPARRRAALGGGDRATGRKSGIAEPVIEAAIAQASVH
jgi:hypothetical protein